MAELGNLAGLLGGSEGKKNVEINVEMLDYGFVEECKDVDVLRGILEKLKSNEYGFYPDVREDITIIY